MTHFYLHELMILNFNKFLYLYRCSKVLKKQKKSNKRTKKCNKKKKKTHISLKVYINNKTIKLLRK